MTFQRNHTKIFVSALITSVGAVAVFTLALTTPVLETQITYLNYSILLEVVGIMQLILGVYKMRGGKLVRTDSRSIAVLAIFAAMVLALEILPIPFLTDIPLFGGFTLDPTGIPISFVFLAYGNVFAFLLIPIMWIAIAYRNPIGSVFKVFAEVYTLVGLVVARLVLRNRQYDWKLATPVYLILGVTFRAIGMYISNIYLIQWLYGVPLDGAIILSASFVIPNIMQAIINIFVGVVLFIIIPENLAIQARFGRYRTTEYDRYEEISVDELESINDD